MHDHPSPHPPLLLVDDEAAWLRLLKIDLARLLGIEDVILCTDSREVEGILARQPVGLVLLDVTMPHLTGEELLRRLSENHPDLPVLMLTGRNELELAVRCMKLGAFDYFIKTQEKERLFASIRKALEISALRRENRRLQESFFSDELRRPEVFAPIVTRNRRMLDIFRYIESIAPDNEPVLICGESGTGKELVAQAIHRLSRPDAPWVAVNVAGLDDHMFSDTLFGHSRGAFTGAQTARDGMIERAGDGTLFLDEIGDLSPASQVKLLRLLQDGEYYPLGSDRLRRCRARIVAATNQDLSALLARGGFRKDLYYRLKVHAIDLPPLRERPEDIPLLLSFFVEEATRNSRRRPPAIPPELPELLRRARLPGNVRELRSLIYDAISRCRGARLPLEPFAAGGKTAPPPTPALQECFDALAALPTIRQATEALVAAALRRSGGIQSLAAQTLGISGAALSKRLKQRKQPSPPQNDN